MGIESSVITVTTKYTVAASKLYSD